MDLDAAGEAFDKSAKLLGLGYPGGPIISKLAQQGNAQAFKLPRPMINQNNFDFSFSGLKTAVLYTVKKLNQLNQQTKADLAASFQQATVDVLTTKTIAAAQKYKTETVMLSGGVAANKLLRKTLKNKTEKLALKFLTPEINLCTDNAAMIGAAAYFAKPIPWSKLKVDPNLEI